MDLGWGGSCALLFALALPAVAFGQPAPAPSPLAPAAREALDRGIQLLRGRRFVEALPSLEESVRLQPSALGWFNLGLACRGANRNAAAVSAFERYLAAPEAGASPARLDAVRAEVEALRRMLARVQVRLQPADAALRLDGREAGHGADPLRVDPGTHVLEASAPAHESYRREFTLQAGGQLELEIVLRPTPGSVPVAPATAVPTPPTPAPTPAPTSAPAAGPQDGELRVEPSVDGAAVAVDGTPRGAGAVTLRLAAGPHRVEVRALRHRPWSREIVVASGGSLRVLAALEADRGTPGWVLPTALVGGAALLAGVGLGVAWLARGAEPPSMGSWGTLVEP
ncbi:MAG: PEGA domain-containing protein [Deltaproteobacteria bacterium]|nr:PEGA domain-containing protein [Deltaproteobacteria bacterium]